MRSKVLELLFKVLENSSGEKLFHGTKFEVHDDNNPVFTETYHSRVNKDGANGEIKIEGLYYSLHFKDDEPNIWVNTQITINRSEEFYKADWFGLNKHFTKVYKFIPETTISFGDFNFKLTFDEHRDLLAATKKSYEKHLSMVDEFNIKKLLLTLHKRLGYYGHVRDN